MTNVTSGSQRAFPVTLTGNEKLLPRALKKDTNLKIPKTDLPTQWQSLQLINRNKCQLSGSPTVQALKL